MGYKVVSTFEMDELLDNCLTYLLEELQNKPAAEHLIKMVSNVYDELEDNPFIFRLSSNPFLRELQYHEAVIPQMDYILIYKIVDNTVYVMGIFHTLEDYFSKIKIIWNRTQ